MKLIVGLGNPGTRYAQTRHNVGFDVVERLREVWGFPGGDQMAHGARMHQGKVSGESVVLVRPQRYMNRSGGPVASVMSVHGLTPRDVVVIHDEMGLPFDTIRCRASGGHGGHNGLRDIIAHIGRDFRRVRVGVGRPPEGVDPAAFVLGTWRDAERARLDDIVGRSGDAATCILTEGIVAAQNRFNVREPRAQTLTPNSPSKPLQPAPDGGSEL
ncbi:MAG: aminoacyl-tRNA hydrolase [Myxococcota bacterium]